METTATTKLKSFWEKPEGKTGMITLAALIGGGLIGFVKILPWLISLATSTLHLAVLLLAIGGIVFLVTNPKVKTLAGIAFKLVMKKLTSCVIKIDPLAILRMKVNEMEENLQTMYESLTKLFQIKSGLERKIKKNASNITDCMQQAAYAQKKGEQGQTFLNANQASRLKKSNMTLQELYTKAETMHRVLTKIYENSKIVIADTKNEIETTAEEYEMVKAATSAMRSAMNAIYGNKDRRAIYEEAYEVLSNDIANKSGELEQMLETSESFMSNIDLQNGMLQENGMKMLEEWEKKSDNWLANSTARPEAKFSEPVEAVIHETNNQFSGLFNK